MLYVVDDVTLTVLEDPAAFSHSVWVAAPDKYLANVAVVETSTHPVADAVAAYVVEIEARVAPELPNCVPVTDRVSDIAFGNFAEASDVIWNVANHWL